MRLINGDALAAMLRSPVRKSKLLVLDLQCLFDYNDGHITDAVHVESGKLFKHRLETGRISVEEFLHRICGVNNLSQYVSCVVYDSESRSPSSLSPNSFQLFFLRQLEAFFPAAQFLEDGFRFFRRRHSSLCSTGCRSPVVPPPPSLSNPCIYNVGPTCIFPCLYLGSSQDANDQKLLNELGITHILNASTTLQRPEFIPESNFLRIPVNDNHNARLLPHFMTAIDFIERVREAKGRVMLHCLMGISRSPSLSIAYVMKRLGMSSAEAYKFVKSKRPSISPNFNFLGQLLEFEKHLARTRLASPSTCPSPLDDLRSPSPRLTPRLSPSPATSMGRSISMSFASSTSSSSSGGLSPTSALANLSFEQSLKRRADEAVSSTSRLRDLLRDRDDEEDIEFDEPHHGMFETDMQRLIMRTSASSVPPPIPPTSSGSGLRSLRLFRTGEKRTTSSLETSSSSSSVTSSSFSASTENETLDTPRTTSTVIDSSTSAVSSNLKKSEIKIQLTPPVPASSSPTCNPPEGKTRRLCLSSFGASTEEDPGPPVAREFSFCSRLGSGIPHSVIRQCEQDLEAGVMDVGEHPEVPHGFSDTTPLLLRPLRRKRFFGVRTEATAADDEDETVRQLPTSTWYVGPTRDSSSSSVHRPIAPCSPVPSLARSDSMATSGLGSEVSDLDHETMSVCESVGSSQMDEGLGGRNSGILFMGPPSATPSDFSPFPLFSPTSGATRSASFGGHSRPARPSSLLGGFSGSSISSRSSVMSDVCSSTSSSVRSSLESSSAALGVPRRPRRIDRPKDFGLSILSRDSAYGSLFGDDEEADVLRRRRTEASSQGTEAHDAEDERFDSGISDMTSPSWASGKSNSSVTQTTREKQEEQTHSSSTSSSSTSKLPSATRSEVLESSLSSSSRKMSSSVSSSSFLERRSSSENKAESFVAEDHRRHCSSEETSSSSHTTTTQERLSPTSPCASSPTSSTGSSSGGSARTTLLSSTSSSRRRSSASSSFQQRETSKTLTSDDRERLYHRQVSEEKHEEEEEEMEEAEEEHRHVIEEDIPQSSANCSGFKRPTTLNFGKSAQPQPTSFLHEFREAREQGRSSFLSSSKVSSSTSLEERMKDAPRRLTKESTFRKDEQRSTSEQAASSSFRSSSTRFGSGCRMSPYQSPSEKADEVPSPGRRTVIKSSSSSSSSSSKKSSSSLTEKRRLQVNRDGQEWSQEETEARSQDSEFTNTTSKLIREELASFFDSFGRHQRESTTSLREEMSSVHNVEKLKEFFSSSTAEMLSRLRRSMQNTMGGSSGLAATSPFGNALTDSSSLCRAYSFPLLTPDPFSHLFPSSPPQLLSWTRKDEWRSCSNFFSFLTSPRHTPPGGASRRAPIHPLTMRESPLTSSNSSIAPIEVSS